MGKIKEAKIVNEVEEETSSAPSYSSDLEHFVNSENSSSSNSDIFRKKLDYSKIKRAYRS